MSDNGARTGTATPDGRAPWGAVVTPAVVAVAAVTDAWLVILFAAIGRQSHDEANGVVGTLSTAWPFLVGLAVGWVVLYALSRRGGRTVRPQRAWPAGITVWVATVLCGMLLRAVTGEGTAFAFVIVATLFNLLTLVGWRLLAQLVAARRR
ncbi:DUF3054 domain-containing protein [Tomitella gaofuii]|uniref:DUF3054 domain-containing protein n=1 Tax=Tomitella gaofuii TaxID=2760083 RepID=UPI002E29C86F|nr:DUF3054 domain-containing protein [Tomitella gaofuii]